MNTIPNFKRETRATSHDLKSDIVEDEFLDVAGMLTFERSAAERSLKQALFEIGELIREKKWEDAAALFHPVDEKFPELLKYDLDLQLREKTAFALGHLKQFDEAMKELSLCIKKEPDNFYTHSSMAYTAYNSLYAAKNREIFLNGKIRQDRIKLAHTYFEEAQKLRPDGVTNYYREGMLFKQLENKAEKSLPLFQKAVSNWDVLDETEKERRHQERKNFVKALYQLSSALLERGNGREALKVIKRCLAEDEKSNYISLIFKYFALGKVHFHQGMFTRAKDALLFAMQCEAGHPKDFVCELLARTYLALGNTGRAMDIIKKIPEKMRRPYYRWTEADVLCANKDFTAAKNVLIHCKERDNRSRHKALIRLAKIEYLLNNFNESLKYAVEAGQFFADKWGGECDDSLFWQAVNVFRLGDNEKALELALGLKELNPRYDKLNLLIEKISYKRPRETTL